MKQGFFPAFFISVIKEPLISVILPFYNAGRTLERALNSILNQTLQNYECILIDNNSTDDSSEIARDFAASDKRFKVIKETKQGVVFASNAGESLAGGSCICRMDADDWMFPFRLEKQLKVLENDRAFSAVCGQVEYVAHQEETAGFKRYVDWVNSLESYQDITMQRFIESPVVNPTAMWRKDVSLKHGMYRDGDFPEDYELWLRWLSVGVRIAKINQPLIKWYDSNERLTRTDPRYSTSAFYQLKSKYLAQWLEQNNSFHPRILVWGANRISRKRVRMLTKYNIEISAYIDISEKRQLDRDVIYYADIPPAGRAFILIYIAHANARKRIRAFLEDKGYREGYNCLFVS